MNPSITLNHIYLDYLRKTGTNSLKNTIVQHMRKLFKAKNQYNAPALWHSTFRALNDINLSMHAGDKIGLIGRNGSGKSSLLRLLAQIYIPSAGSININGKALGLFNIQMGLNPEATGYENIITLGIMQGLSKQAAIALTPDVETFTELGSALYDPVRTYSTGMQLKLGFAVITANQPDILLIDEIIGVGDAHFMKKSKQRMKQFTQQTKVLVLASHDSSIIKDFCNKVMILEQGRMIFFGDIEEGIARYNSQAA